ncbi:ABC transporter substrate-binding protein [Gluconacetobacter sp. Hr-1-5]|uniref:DUF5983 family protein n=1 Tax=Gluconacetobacter sp. Hr-1-5 TaxID=3395370 RepID=UPI003B51F143
MSHEINPFARGYQNLRVVRMLCIDTGAEYPLLRRPVHPGQGHFSDDDLLHSRCIVTLDFAVIPDDRNTGTSGIEPTKGNAGVVRAILYAVYGDDFDGQPIHIGDAGSPEAARQTVRRLSFETGIYSRSWEISAAHLTGEAWEYLTSLATEHTPTGFPFIVFPITDSPAVGVKLFATPWTDDNLRLDGITPQELRQENLDRGLPVVLADILQRAGEADIRILIFDQDAPDLEGLELYEP